MLFAFEVLYNGEVLNLYHRMCWSASVCIDGDIIMAVMVRMGFVHLI